MDRGDEAPIVCTLQPGDYKERLAWLVELAREGLLDVSREDLRLELKYAPSVADRVREMVHKEHGSVRMARTVRETATTAAPWHRYR
jgi:hypothetical protein